MKQVSHYLSWKYYAVNAWAGLVGRCIFTSELHKQKTLENEILHNCKGNYGCLEERYFHQVLLSICKVFWGVLDNVEKSLLSLTQEPFSS